MAKDGRASFLPLARKLSIVNKVIDHIVDGNAVPKHIFRKDDERPDNHFLPELWKTAERAVRSVLEASR